MFGRAASGQAGVAHAAERPERDRRARAVVRAGRGDAERDEPLRSRGRIDPARDLRLVVERQEGDDRQRRHGAHRLDRDDELVEVEERLDHEQVDAAALEHARLRGVEGAVLGRVEDLELAQRADRPGDEDVPPRDLARLPREAHARGVDLLERVLEERAGELAPVGAERVRLDQLRAGGDVSRVHGDDALGRAEIRLLGTAEAGDGARDEGTHAAVCDDRRARGETVEEAAHEPATLDACPEMVW